LISLDDEERSLLRDSKKMTRFVDCYRGKEGIVLVVVLASGSGTDFLPDMGGLGDIEQDMGQVESWDEGMKVHACRDT
jgi:hypothetical protein